MNPLQEVVMDRKPQSSTRRHVAKTGTRRPSLERSEDRLRIIIEKTGLLVYDYDVNTGKIVWSGAIRKLTGFSKAEFAGVDIVRWGEMIHPDDRPAALEALEKANRSIGTYDVEYRFLCKNGTYIFVDDHGVFLQDSDGKACRMLGTMKDISDRKRAEQKYLDIFENAIDGIFQSSPSGRFLSVNPAMARMYGYDSPQEMIAAVSNIEGQIYVDRDGRRKFTRELQAHGHVERFISKEYRKDGSIIWTSTNARAVRDETGKLLYYEGFIRNITQRKKGEEALQASEEKYRTLFSNSALAVGIRTPDGAPLEFNDAYARMLGYTREELKSLKTADVTHPEDVKITRKSMKMVADGKADILRYEKRYLHKDGSIVWGNTCIQPLRSAEGKIVALIGTVVDVTERKQAEQALRESEQRFRDILEKVHLVSQTLDTDGNVTFVNDFLLELVGYRRSELMGKNWIDICVPSEARQEVREYFSRLVNSGTIPGHHENEILTRSGDRRLIAWNNMLLHDPTGAVIGIASIGEDITERKKAEEALRESEKRFRDILEKARFVSDILDTNGNVLFANDYLLKMLGFQREELLGKNWVDLCVPPERREEVKAYFHSLIAHDTVPGHHENEILTRAGEHRLIIWSNTILHDPDGKAIGIAGIGEDITERKQTEQALRESERRYRAILEKTRLVSVMLDTSGKITFANDFLLDLCGWTRQELLGRNWFETCLPANIRQEVMTYFSNFLENDAFPSHFENEIVTRTGEHRLIVWNNTTLYDSDGRIGGTASIGEDITERKQAEAALLEREEQFRSLFENASVGICVTDFDGHVLLFNSAILQPGGYTPEDIRGLDDIAKIYADPGDREKIGKLFWENGRLQGYRMRFKRKDGTPYTAMLSISTIRFGGRQCVQAIVEDISERTRSEEERARLTAILESTNDLVSTFTPDKRLTYLNAAGWDMLGWDVSAGLQGRTIAEVHPSWAYDLVAGQGIPAALEKGYWRGETAILRPDGSEVPVSQAILAHRDPEGAPQYLSTMMRDITDLKEAEQAIRESEERYRLLIEHSPDAIAVHQQGRIVFANPATLKLLGASSPDQLLGKPVLDFVHPDERGMIDNRMREVPVVGSPLPPMEEKFVRLDGTLIDVEAVALPILYNGQPAIQVMVRDITERKRAEAALRAAETNYRSIFEQAPIGIFQSTPEGRFLEANQALANIYGYGSPEEMISTVEDIAGQIFVDRAGREEFRRLLAENDQVQDFESLEKRKDGSIIWTSNNAQVIKDADGRIVRYEGFIRDITERKQAVEALKKNEKELNAIFRVAPIGIGVVSNRILKAGNARLCAMTGYSWEELKDQSARILYPSDEEYEYVGDEKYRQIAAKGTGTVETVWRRKDGSTINVLLSSTPIDPADQARGVTFTALDITERKQAEHALRESEEKYRTIIEQFTDGMILADEDGRVIEWNRACEAMTGLPRQAVMGSYVWDVQLALLHPDQRTPERRQWLEEFGRSVLASGQSPYFDRPTDVEIYRSNGEKRDARQILFPVATSRGFRIATVFSDITERKQAETALRDSESRLRHASQVAHLGHYQMDILTGTWESSEVLDEIFGIDKGYQSDVSGWIQIVHPEDREQMLHYFQKEVLENRGSFDREYRIQRIADQEMRWVHGLGRLELDKGGLPIRMIGTIQIITARKLAEEALLARTTELEALYTVSTALRAARTVEEMMPLILAEVRRVFSADAGTIVLLNPDQASFTIALADGLLAANTGRHFPAEESLCGEVLRTRRPVIAENITDTAGRLPGVLGEEELGPEMIVPILSESEMLGALSAHRSRGKPTFSPEEIRLMETMGEIIGNALRRASLYDQALERLEHVQALRNIDLAITASIDPRVTLDILLGEIITQLKIDAADVLLYNPHTLMLDYTAGRGLKPDLRRQVRIGEGMAGRIAAERRKIGFADLTKAQEMLSPAERETLESFVSYYGAPMIAKGQIIGVLETFHRTPLEMTAEWVEFLEAVANQAAITIDNARLFDGLQRANLDLSLAYDATIAGWSRALDLREHETERHSDRVTAMTMHLARSMGIADEDLIHLRRGALLHDIGKMGIPDAILLKPGRLTLEERLIMRQHPIFAYEMLSTIAYLRPALDIPYCHHEKWDGNGYPRGLAGEQIPLTARIFAVADVYDALTNQRPYRPAWPKQKALDFIRRQAGRQFDPQVVELFFNTLRTRPDLDG